MNKTTFIVSKMDCPSEESLIQMKLAGLNGIKSLTFDVPSRKLIVYHTQSPEAILTELKELNLGTSLFEHGVVADDTTFDSPKLQTKLLRQVLLINFLFFILEAITGFLSHSLGLLADSVDMLADSIVYGLALMAVGGSFQKKNRIAAMSGYLQLGLAVMGIAEVIRRFTGDELNPEYKTMIFISVLALIGNSICLVLLQKSKSQETHIKASMIFTSNDVIVNGGVILAGVMVYLSQSRYPDLIIGSIEFVLVTQGAIRILKLSKNKPPEAV